MIVRLPTRRPALPSLVGRTTLALVLSLSTAPGLGAQLTTELALDVRTPSILDATDDARYVALFLATRRGRTDTDHFRFGDPTYIAPRYGELMIVDAVEGATWTLYDGPVQVRAARWSPDGTRLAYYLRQGDGYELHIHEPGGRLDRRVELRTTKALSSQALLEWTPDSRSLLVELRPEGWAEEARSAFLELTEGPVVVQDASNDFLAWDRVRNLGGREIPALVDIASGAVRELAGETRLADARFSRDGARLLFTTATPTRTAYARNEGTAYTLETLDLSSGVRQVAVEARERPLRPRWNEAGSAFAYAEDGDVFVRRLDADSAVNLTAAHREVVEGADTTRRSFSLLAWRPDGEALLAGDGDGWVVLDPEGGPPRRVFAFEEDEESRPRRSFVAWSEDGASIFFSSSAPDRWWRGLRRLDAASGSVEDVLVDEQLYRSWTVARDGSRVVFRRSDGDRPDEIWALEPGGSPRRLTELNPQLGEVELARTELVSYLDLDGERQFGILYYPIGYEEGKRYPLVAEIYEDFFDNGYHENMNLVAAQGWFGFRPSVTFETGYPGEAWFKAVPNAINALIDRGLVDPDRVGVYGQSYGGYAVNLLITQTDRFAAAANVSGKVNIISFLGDSPRITTRNYRAAEEGQDRIGATLWEQPHKYINTSAVMFADRIDTPLLLLSGEGDWNVPATNQREMYYALRRLGKEVVWVNYMKGGHGAGRASTVEDFHDHWRRMFAWFRVHFEAGGGGGER